MFGFGARGSAVEGEGEERDMARKGGGVGKDRVMRCPYSTDDG